MRIAVAVHGRFYAFDLARALIQRGHDVRVFTNYPKWAARRFGLPARNVESFWLHGILARLAGRLGRFSAPFVTVFLHRLFGWWAAKRISAEQWDIVHVFSGVAEEVLSSSLGPATVKQLVRASSHIRVQDRILSDEMQRVGCRIERPAPWMIAREEREYAIADEIVVLSEFAFRSFLDQDVAAEKMRLLPLGVDTSRFKPSADVLDERCRRIQAGEPLRVLMTGTMSFRKGFHDFVRMVQELEHEPFRFRFIGGKAPEVAHLVSTVKPMLEIIPSQPQLELSQWYAEADLFVFPTLEDGFPVVLSQAHAAALPILTTTNCSGPDLIQDDQTGWVLPVRNANRFVDRLRWCHRNRERVVEMIRRIYSSFQPRDWDDVAGDFEQLAANSRSSRQVA